MTSNALFLASQPGLDFLNTRFARLPEGTPVEVIGDGAAFLSWLVEASLLERAVATRLTRRFSAAQLDAAAADARKLRHWAEDWIARWREHPDADFAAELRRLNGLLERVSAYRSVAARSGKFAVTEHARIEAPGDLLGLVAWQVAKLVLEESPELVKRCAGSGCVLWFLDRTKAHRRVFCSAQACGNRAKVAAFRERQRESR
ncbi:MAG TPA: CGNR zinc finger domain-containing protein [Polyangiaceae bacterium]|nr:CGNR zinc finger domain-containing protein [Polyangiaceae bacterium]